MTQIDITTLARRLGFECDRAMMDDEAVLRYGPDPAEVFNCFCNDLTDLCFERGAITTHCPVPNDIIDDVGIAGALLEAKSMTIQAFDRFVKEHGEEPPRSD